MANTFSAADGTFPLPVAGNMRMIMGKATMTDAGTGGIVTGLSVVYSAMITGNTLTADSTSATVSLNSVAGEVQILSAASGDIYHLVAWGR